jgi:hypothetical protein
MDFRALGFDCAGVLMSASVGEVMRNLATGRKSVHEDAVDGISCLRLDLELVSKTRMSFWIAPQLGHCILRVLGTNDEIGITDEVKFTAQQWARSGIWFPASYAHRRQRAGRVFDHEAGSVTIHSINEAIPATAYELKSFRIPVGHGVQIVPGPDGSSRMWDGEKIVLKSGHASPLSATAGRGGVVLPLGAGAAILLPIVFLIRGIRRRNAPFPDAI